MALFLQQMRQPPLLSDNPTLIPTVHRFRFALISTLILGFGLVRSNASPVLYYSPVGNALNAGLGASSSTLFTQAVVNQFGASNVRSIADFSNTATYSDADVLFINLRGDSDALQGQEKTNIINFINAGGAVFFIGEHNQWATWDNSFLGIYGGSVVPWGTFVQNSGKTAATPSQFTAGGFNGIAVSNPGGISGGTGIPIYMGAVNPLAEMYGPSNNAIAFMDTLALSNSNSNQSFFYGNLASWLYVTGSAYETSQANNGGGGSSVPDSGAGLALAGTVLMMGAVRASRRR
jgi:hypothetical protein